MSLFDIFRKKKQMKALPSIENTQPPIVYRKELTIHPDIKNLLWFGDGAMKNHTTKPKEVNTFRINGYVVTVSFSGAEEPSLIFLDKEIIEPKENEEVERPSYYPNFKTLTPKQRWNYVKLLEDPYNPENDIGYVFILYYGLERHLLEGDFDKAFNVILKLRDAHANKSFQHYSANALILSSMLHNKGDYVIEFLNSLDKNFEFNFSCDLFLMCYLSFNIPINAIDLMRFAKSFGFSKSTYIKKHPCLFKDELDKVIMKNFESTTLDLSQLIDCNALDTVETKNTSIFANTSINEQLIPIPQLSNIPSLRDVIFLILNQSHENTKIRLRDLRKIGDPEAFK